MPLVSVYYSTFMCDIIHVPGCHQVTFDGVALLEVDLDAYFATNILDTETLSVRFHNMCVVMIVVGVVSAGVTTPGTGVDLCVAIFKVFLGFKSVEVTQGVFAPG